MPPAPGVGCSPPGARGAARCGAGWRRARGAARTLPGAFAGEREGGEPGRGSPPGRVRPGLLAPRGSALRGPRRGFWLCFGRTRWSLRLCGHPATPAPGPRPRRATAPSTLCSVPAAPSSLNAGPRLPGSTPLGNGRPTLGASLSLLCRRPASPARPTGVGGGSEGVEGTFQNTEPLTLSGVSLSTGGRGWGLSGTPHSEALCAAPPASPRLEVLILLC